MGPHESTPSAITVNVYHCTNTVIPDEETCYVINWDWTIHSEESLSLDHVINGNSFTASFKNSQFSVGRRTIYGSEWSHKISWSSQDKTLWVNLEFMTKCDANGNYIHKSSEYVKFVRADLDDGKPDKEMRSQLMTVFPTLAVNMYDCEISKLHPKEKCSETLLEQNLKYYLPIDKWVSLDYSNNRYAMKAILNERGYFCVKNRFFNVESEEYIKKTCHKMLGPNRVEKLLAVYEESKICDESAQTQSCDFVKQKYLKFVNRNDDKKVDNDFQQTMNHEETPVNTSQPNVSLFELIVIVTVMLLILLLILLIIFSRIDCYIDCGIANQAKKNKPYNTTAYVEKDNPYFKMI